MLHHDHNNTNYYRQNAVVDISYYSNIIIYCK